MSLSSIRPKPRFDTAAVVTRANAAAAAWTDADVLPFLTDAVSDAPADARRWHVLGLALRNLDRHADALAAFREAVARAPADALAAHALARTALEAGLPATALFDRALALAPLEAPVILGRAAAQFGESGPAPAIADLTEQLRRHPAWYEGHATVARLQWLAGERQRSGDTFEAAAAVRPADGLLWREYALVLLRAGDYPRLHEVLARARGHVGRSRTLDLIEAAARSEAGELDAAGALFARHLPVSAEFVASYGRYLLRAGRPADAAVLFDGCIGHDRTHELLPLAALAWRLTGDPRFEALRTDLVRTYDLADQIESMAVLADALRALHQASDAPLDQSLRRGTQTDGPLFARLDPPIRALREVILGAVARYVADLPAAVPEHPLLGERRAPLRYAGSWSVRLTDGGHHVDHVHPAGWISSACYVVVPETTPGDRAGWLTLGDAPSLGLPLEPLMEIEPKPGRLVLFPSFLWHRTRPFPAGERLTVAFDIARAPR